MDSQYLFIYLTPQGLHIHIPAPYAYTTVFIWGSKLKAFNLMPYPMKGVKPMQCRVPVKVKDPTIHLEVEVVPEKVYVIRNHMGKVIKIGLFTSPKTGKKFRALLPDAYPVEDC